MRHHYVPQFLLRPWTEDSLDKKYEEDLYALIKPIVAGVDQQAVEKQFLMRVDNLGADARTKLHNEGLRALTKEDRVDWARFLMSLRIRQPDTVRKLRVDSTGHLRATLATQPEQYEELAGLGDPPTLTQWIEKHFPGVIENFGLSFFHELVDNKNIGGQLLRMKWWIWDFSDLPYDLLLADHPCIFTTGIDDTNLVVALPISPWKAFMATQSDRTSDLLRRQRPRDLAMRINESSLSQARVRIYARDQSPSRFIRNRLWMRQPTQER